MAEGVSLGLVPRALAAQRLTTQSAAWSLLRADNAPVIVAVLQHELGHEVRRRPAPVLFERVDADLEELRAQFDLPGTGASYCTDWRKAGWLVRRVEPGAREETLELSDGALAAIGFVTGLTDRRQTVTESRLSTIIDRVHDLTVATDPDSSSRLALLTAQRDALDAEIARVSAGDYHVLPVGEARERVDDILDLTAQLPADFSYVRAQIEQINATLRRQLVEEVATRGDVLDEVFAGIDRLGESDAGRSFDGFYRLLLDPERSGELEWDLEALSGRDFARSLPVGQARALRRLLPSLMASSREIHDVMTTLNRSLRRFVTSQEFHESRVLHRLLLDAAHLSLAAATRVQPFTPIDVHVDLPVTRLRSAAEVAPYDPAESHVVEPDRPSPPPAPVDLAAITELARAADIDWAELSSAVNAVLAGRGAATIGEVLTEHPATQGVASVIGLLVLAVRHGHLLEGTENVEWTPEDGPRRAGEVPLALFTEVV